MSNHKYRCCSADHPRGSQRSSKRATALVSNVIACLHSGSARCCRCGKPPSGGSPINASMTQREVQRACSGPQTDERRPQVGRGEEPTRLRMGPAKGRRSPFLCGDGSLGQIEQGLSLGGFFNQVDVRKVPAVKGQAGVRRCTTRRAFTVQGCGDDRPDQVAGLQPSPSSGRGQDIGQPLWQPRRPPSPRQVFASANDRVHVRRGIRGAEPCMPRRQRAVSRPFPQRE
jgi:hypothetical protein